MHTLLPVLFLGLSVTPLLAKTPTVLVLGDSLSAGYGLNKSEGYPELLAKKAADAGFSLHVINAGVSGDTTSGGLRRLPHLLRQRVDVLVLELGINDAFRGVIAGMQLPQAASEDYLARFGAIFGELARRNDAELVPFLLEDVAGNPSLNLNDLIHPNAAGQRILAQNVWPVLERALRDREPAEKRS